MKTKILVSSLVIGALTMAASVLYAQQHTGPKYRSANYKAAKTDYNIVSFEAPDGREWLVLRGNERATTIDDQWGPHALVIDSMVEPVVTERSGRWEIRFRPAAKP